MFAKASESQLLPIRGHLIGLRAGAQPGVSGAGMKDAHMCPQLPWECPLQARAWMATTHQLLLPLTLATSSSSPPSRVPCGPSPPFFSLSCYLLLLFCHFLRPLRGHPSSTADRLCGIQGRTHPC